jgi:putative membrane protein
MLRATLPALAACLLALSSCSSSTDTAGTTTTGTSTATGDASATTAATSAPAATDSSAAASSATAAAAPQSTGKADPNGPTAPHANDAEFMKSAAHSDQNEIQLSKMALAKGVTGMTQTFANQMIADHTKSSADMDAEHKAMAPEFQKLTGKAFEDKYIKQMVADHQKTANTMASHQQMTKNTALQGFITTTLPVVESHLDMASKGATMKM